jgi:RNA polymerase sigma factor (sigma-70 family)
MSNDVAAQPEHLKMVFAASTLYAIKYHGDPGEHVSHAWMGLHDAASKFDEQRGVKFSTYSYRRINGAIRDGVREEQGRNGKYGFNQSLRPLGVRDEVLARPECPAVDMDFWRIACRGLSKSERILLLLYFVEGLPLWQIGQQHIGLSESRCSQMLSDLGPFIAITLWRHGLVE